MIQGTDTIAAEPAGALSRWPIGRILAFATFAIGGLTWAKWLPSWHRLANVFAHHAVGQSILTKGHPGTSSPSWRAAVDFTTNYFNAVWLAMLAGLVIAAGVEVLLPRDWLVRTMSRGWWRVRGPGVAGLAAMPSMLCTCCAAPIAVSMRRQNVPVGSALAYFLANPTLNPVVLIFMAAVLPWPWVAVRLVVGVVLVFVIAPLVARLAAPKDTASVPAATVPAVSTMDPVRDEAAVPVRFIRALARLAVTLLPEYLVVVMVLGAFQGWLLPLTGHPGLWGGASVLLFAVAGTLFAIPTAGEIPIIHGFLSAGMNAGPVGALVITLPAVSAPSLIMTARSMRPRVMLAIAGVVILLGVLAGAALTVLT